ncbi:MAG: ribonuclease E/G, partial [Candidatus Hinthialibacter sp.]
MPSFKNNSNNSSQRPSRRSPRRQSTKAKQASSPSPSQPTQPKGPSDRSNARKRAHHNRTQTPKQAAQDSKNVSEPKIQSPKDAPIHRLIFANEADYSIAVIAENHHLTDFWIAKEQTYDHGTSGNIYRGVVSRVLPSLNAAFVNLGLEKDGFLSFADLSPEFQKTSKSNRSTPPLKVGDKVLVQMAKEAIADKGPSLTGKISLPGRFVVYMPHAEAIRMSRMLSEGEKKRFRELVSKGFSLKGGLIFRTASKSRSKSDIQHDLNYLTRIW